MLPDNVEKRQKQQLRHSPAVGIRDPGGCGLGCRSEAVAPDMAISSPPVPFGMDPTPRILNH